MSLGSRTFIAVAPCMQRSWGGHQWGSALVSTTCVCSVSWSWSVLDPLVVFVRSLQIVSTRVEDWSLFKFKHLCKSVQWLYNDNDTPPSFSPPPPRGFFPLDPIALIHFVRKRNQFPSQFSTRIKVLVRLCHSKTMWLILFSSQPCVPAKCTLIYAP